MRGVGGGGAIYAQDVEERMLRRVGRKLKGFDYRNVQLLLYNSTAIELPDNSCDVLFCANVLEEIYWEGELAASIEDFDRVLKKGGLFVIKEHCPGGTRHVVEEALQLLAESGYRITARKRTLLSFHLQLIREVHR
ncbi:MAG: class I SAM-dependent methyltransferase [Deltaproteobacteria bacterium]|nr:class I SAM-dependent methyltransferase [Deltaproteobacteria bacterium]